MLVPLTARGHQLHPGSYIQSWSKFFMSQKKRSWQFKEREPVRYFRVAMKDFSGGKKEH